MEDESRISVCMRRRIWAGATEINRYQNEITDIVRRRSIRAANQQVPATHPSRFFEQTGIPADGGAGVCGSAKHRPFWEPDSGGTKRTAKAPVLSRSTQPFDMEVGSQQSQFLSFPQAKDLRTLSKGCCEMHDSALWNEMIHPDHADYATVLQNDRADCGGRQHDYNRHLGEHRGRIKGVVSRWWQTLSASPYGDLRQSRRPIDREMKAAFMVPTTEAAGGVG
jgi:hypothetical protein